MKITKDSNLLEVVQKHPETAEVFMKHGLHCIGCMAAQYESIEQGAKAHGIDVKKLVKELNEIIEKKK